MEKENINVALMAQNMMAIGIKVKKMERVLKLSKMELNMKEILWMATDKAREI